MSSYYYTLEKTASRKRQIHFKALIIQETETKFSKGNVYILKKRARNEE